MKTQECIRKWYFHLFFRIRSQHRIKGCCALRSVLFQMEKKIKLQHLQKFRCIPENLSEVVWVCRFNSCYEFGLKWPPKSVNSLAKQLILLGCGWKPCKPTEFFRNSSRSQSCSDTVKVHKSEIVVCDTPPLFFFSLGKSSLISLFRR